MSDFHALIRLRRWELDEQRRRHVELEAQCEQLKQECDRLVETLAAERSVAGTAETTMPGLDEYLRHTLQRRQMLVDHLTEMSASRAESQDAVATAYRELTKFELAAKHALERRRRQLSERQQRDLDEIAIGIYRRGSSDET